MLLPELLPTGPAGAFWVGTSLLKPAAEGQEVRRITREERTLVTGELPPIPSLQHHKQSPGLI